MSALCYSVGLAYLVYHALREKSRAWEYFICCLQKSKIRRQKEKEDADGADELAEKCTKKLVAAGAGDHIFRLCRNSRSYKCLCFGFYIVNPLHNSL